MCWLKQGIKNPWAIVNSENVFADGDYGYATTIMKDKKLWEFGTQDYLKEIKRVYGCGLTFECIPDPYCGDPDANVYCLNMNPGEPDPYFDQWPLTMNKYTNKSFDNLKHKVSSAFWTENLVMDDKGVIRIDAATFASLLNKSKTDGSNRIHGGARWQFCKTDELRNLLGRHPNVFFLEYFPYHSRSGFDFPDYLPSYDYRNSLLEYAMNTNKLIIIMRKRNDWYKIKDKNIGIRLRHYKKKVFLRYGQGGWLTRDNITEDIPDNRCDSISWNDIISMM